MEYPEISFHALFAYAKMLTNMRNRPVFMRIYAIDTYLRCRIIPIFLIIFFYFSFLNEYVSRIYPPKFDFSFFFQVKWPNGISIDSVAERVYWVDAALDFIASVNLDGGDFKKAK